MFFRSILATSVALLAAAAQVQAHVILTPALGIKGAGTRNDVQRPSTAAPCGKIPVSDLATATAVNAAADGTFSVTATGFDSGKDGSRALSSAQVDTAATGKAFTGTVKIVKNGVALPTSTGSDQLSLQLPAGTACTGGADGKTCLVALKTESNFGNCIAVSQGGAKTKRGTGSGAAVAVAAAKKQREVDDSLAIDSLI